MKRLIKKTDFPYQSHARDSQFWLSALGSRLDSFDFFVIKLTDSDYRLVVTNNPREASACVNCRIALSVVAKFLAFSTLRRSAFSAGSLSLIIHRHTNILAS